MGQGAWEHFKWNFKFQRLLSLLASLIAELLPIRKNGQVGRAKQRQVASGASKSHALSSINIDARL